VPLKRAQEHKGDGRRSDRLGRECRNDAIPTNVKILSLMSGQNCLRIFKCYVFWDLL